MDTRKKDTHVIRGRNAATLPVSTAVTETASPIDWIAVTIRAAELRLLAADTVRICGGSTWAIEAETAQARAWAMSDQAEKLYRTIFVTK